MKILLFLLFIFGLFNADIICQVADTVQVKQIQYNYVTGGSRFMNFSDQQLEARPHYLRGTVHSGNSEYVKAIIDFKLAIEIDSTGNACSGRNGMAHIELGHVYYMLNDYENALQYFNNAIGINKLYCDPYIKKAKALLAMNELDSAIETMNEAIELIPEAAMLYFQRGSLFNSIKKFESALNDFYKFLDLAKEQKQLENAKILVEQVEKSIREIESKIPD